MFFLFYKFLFFLSDFLEIQRKSFYLFLNELLSQEFLKIQPLYNFRTGPRRGQKNLKLPSTGFAPKWQPEGLSDSEGTVQSIRFSSKNLFERAFKKTGPKGPLVPFGHGEAPNNNPLEGMKRFGASGFSPKPPKKISPIAPLGGFAADNPKDPTNDRITTIYFLSNNYKFIKPTLNIEESILFSKTYCCHFYIPVKLLDNLTHFTEIRWIFLGTLPLLTRRGHFIINGTPRIVLNQIVRSPGIYFHSSPLGPSGKGSPLFYAEIISKSGPWVRVEIDQKKRIWVLFQQIGSSADRAKTKNPLSHFFHHFYQKYLDHHLFLNEKKSPTLDALLLNEFFWKDVFYKEPKNKIEANIRNKKIEVQVLGQRGPLLSEVSGAAPLGQLCWPGTVNKSEPQHPPQVFFQKLWKKFKRFKTDEERSSHKKTAQSAAPRLENARRGPSKNRNPLFLSKPQRAKFIYLKSGSFGHYHPVQTGSLRGPQLLHRPMAAKVSSQKQKSNFKYRTFRIGSDILFASSSKNADLGLNLSPSGRMRLNQRLGLSLKTLTLTPIDFLTISDILYRWVQDGHHPNIMAEKIPLDDIDDLKNRRLKTIGELLQNQLARGLQRLQKTFENTVQKDWIKFLNHQTSHSSLSFLNDFNLNRKKNWVKPNPTGALPYPPTSYKRCSTSRSNTVSKIQTWQPELHHPKNKFELLTNDSNIFKKHSLEKRNFYLQKIRKIHIFKNRTFGYRFGSSQRLATKTADEGTHSKQLYYLLTKLHFKRNFLWKELFLYQKTGPNRFGALNQLSKRGRPPALSTSILSIINSLSINSTFKEFFHSHQLSQFLDQSNPLAEITHKRRLSCLGSGGITRETAGMEIRGIHLSHYGRICPIETPEGKNAGLVNSLTTTVHVNYKGFLETPYIEIYKQHYQNQKNLMFFSVENQELKKVFLNPKLPKLRNISVGIIKPQTQNFYKLKIDYINLMAFHPIQFLSIATTCIPFIEHDDANRALMGSNMQRQALPLIYLEQPIVTTLNAFRVLSDLKDIPITSESGMILYVSQQKISYYGLGASPERGSFGDLAPFGLELGRAWSKALGKAPDRLNHPRSPKGCQLAALRAGWYEDSKLCPRKGAYQLF